MAGYKRVKGNGEAATEKRAVDDFSSVELAGAIDVEVQQGTTYGVTVMADRNLLQYVETSVHGDELVIRTRRNYNLRPRTRLKVVVTAPQLTGLSVTGSGSLRSAATLQASNKVQASITGSGDIEAAVDAPEVEVEVTGSGTARLRGQTRNLSTETSGSGDIQCFDLASERAKVSVTGSGSAQVFASKNLDVRIMGSGDVSYKGTPVVTKRTTGSGSVAQVQ